MSTFCCFSQTVSYILRSVNIPDLLYGFLLLNTLSQLDDVRLQSVVLGVGFDVVEVAEEWLIVRQRHTVEVPHSVPTHLSQDFPHQEYRGKHLLHTESLCCC